MKLSLVVADYEHTPMSFNSEGWFNATVAAEKFSKRPADWLALESTQAYIAVLAEILTCEKSSLLKTSRARVDRGGGTWMHPKLAVRFAQWLDTRFAVWCDLQIDGLLRGQHPHHAWQHLRHEAAASHKVMCAMLKLVREENGKETAPYHYSNEARMVNWALTGEFQPIDRATLTPHELTVLAKLEEQNAILIGRGVDYRFRKPALETLARVLLQPALAA